MEDQRVLEIVETLEKGLRELAEITKETYIDCCILNGNFMLSSGVDKNGQTKLNFFKKGGKQ